MLKQSLEEVMTHQLEQSRLFEAIRRINAQQIVLKETEQPTPFAFPILADSIRRQNLTSEETKSRIAKMQVQLERRIESLDF